MNNKQKSCEERIDSELRDRIKDIRKVLKAADPIFALNELALALSKEEVYKLELSWGGPQDYFTFVYDPDSRQLTEITYHFLDWFDGAKRTLKYGSREYKLLEELFYTCIKL